MPVLCLPGNHDRFIPTRAPIIFRPGGTEFDRLADYSHVPVHPIELTCDLPNDRRLRAVVLGADLTLKRLGDHEGTCGWLAQGRAYERICNSLSRATEWHRKRKKEEEVLCVLWAVHFPPEFPGIPRHSRLLDERKFIEAANHAGVDAVLAGHTHRQLAYRNPAMSFRVFCCGTTTQHEPRALAGGRDEGDTTKGNLFQIITVEADSGGRAALSTGDYRYSNLGSPDGPSLMCWSNVSTSLG